MHRSSRNRHGSRGGINRLVFSTELIHEQTKDICKVFYETISNSLSVYIAIERRLGSQAVAGSD